MPGPITNHLSYSLKYYLIWYLTLFPILSLCYLCNMSTPSLFLRMKLGSKKGVQQVVLWGLRVWNSNTGVFGLWSVVVKWSTWTENWSLDVKSKMEGLRQVKHAWVHFARFTFLKSSESTFIIHSKRTPDIPSSLDLCRSFLLLIPTHRPAF